MPVGPPIFLSASLFVPPSFSALRDDQVAGENVIHLQAADFWKNNLTRGGDIFVARCTERDQRDGKDHASEPDSAAGARDTGDAPSIFPGSGPASWDAIAYDGFATRTRNASVVDKGTGRYEVSTGAVAGRQWLEVGVVEPGGLWGTYYIDGGVGETGEGARSSGSPRRGRGLSDESPRGAVGSTRTDGEGFDPRRKTPTTAMDTVSKQWLGCTAQHRASVAVSSPTVDEMFRGLVDPCDGVGEGGACSSRPTKARYPIVYANETNAYRSCHHRPDTPKDHQEFSFEIGRAGHTSRSDPSREQGQNPPPRPKDDRAPTRPSDDASDYPPRRSLPLNPPVHRGLQSPQPILMHTKMDAPA